MLVPVATHVPEVCSHIVDCAALTPVAVAAIQVIVAVYVAVGVPLELLSEPVTVCTPATVEFNTTVVVLRYSDASPTTTLDTPVFGNVAAVPIVPSALIVVSLAADDDASVIEPTPELTIFPTILLTS